MWVVSFTVSVNFPGFFFGGGRGDGESEGNSGFVVVLLFTHLFLPPCPPHSHPPSSHKDLD